MPRVLGEDGNDDRSQEHDDEQQHGRNAKLAIGDRGGFARRFVADHLTVTSGSVRDHATPGEGTLE